MSIGGRVSNILAKTEFTGFETGFAAFAVLFLAPWSFFCLDRCTVAKIRVKTCLLALKLVFAAFAVLFLHFEFFLGLSEVRLPRYGHKHVFVSCETGFTAFVVLFFHFGCIFEKIGGTIAKIRANTCSPDFKLNLRHPLSFFSTLEVILPCSVVLLPRYGRKCVFVGVETGFTIFSVLFLALWRFYCADQRYRCHDTGINVCSPALNWFYGICRSFFSTFEIVLRQFDVLLPRYGRKRVFTVF